MVTYHSRLAESEGRLFLGKNFFSLGEFSIEWKRDAEVTFKICTHNGGRKENQQEKE